MAETKQMVPSGENHTLGTLFRWRLSLRVFGCLPDTDAWGRTEAGVRKASREETAGEVAPTLVSVYGEFVAAA